MDIIQDEQVNLKAIVATCDNTVASSLARPFVGVEPNLNESLTLAKAGALLIPLRPMVFDQDAGCFICTCSKGKACGATGKHPMLVGWTDKASNDPEQIEKWWLRSSPGKEIGIGQVMGGSFFSLDIDGPEGEASLARLVAKYGPLPETLQSSTGRTDKGRHLRFRKPVDRKVISRTYDRGLDVKGEGSYLVAPPTLHKSGARYQWIKLVPIAEAPKWLFDALDTPLNSRQSSKPNGEDKSNDNVPTGTLGERPSHLPKRAAPKTLADARIKSLAPDFPPWSAATEADLDNLLEHIDGATRDHWRDVGMVFAHWIIIDADLEPTLRKKFDDWSLRWPDRFNAADQENQWRDWVQRADSRKKNGEPLKTYGSLVVMAGGREKCPEPSPTPAPQAPASSSSPDDEAVFQRLAALPVIDYERIRADEAENLGVRVSVLDKEVSKRRLPEKEESGPGSALSLPTPEPWPDPVSGAELLDAIVKAITGYVVMTETSAVSAALWCVHAHAFEASYISPRLAITSPEKRCGKTTLLRIVQALVPKPLPAANITAAALFRTIEAFRPTLLIDEADTFLKENEELRGVINSGHARDGQVIRLVGEGYEPRVFSTCCPTSIAAIGSLPGTIEDRSIPIAMRRRRSDEPAARFRPDRVSHLHELCRKIARWAADNATALRDADPTVPSELHDRAADNWRPLFAIADLAGEQCPERARAAALAQSAEGPSEEDSLTIMLLRDIRDVFAARKADRLPSEKLVEHLVSLQDRPWPTLNCGKGLSPARLARMLRPFGITPRTIRTDSDKTPKGYYLVAFEDAFVRYLAVRTATPPHN